MISKYCCRCNEQKALAEFSKRTSTAQGVQPYCKPCTRENNRENYKKNGHTWKSRKNISWEDHYEKYSTYYINKAYNRHRNISRSTPSWNNRFFMDEAYALAKLRTRILGFAWHVDHVIPLKGRFVSGLHVDNNLQVIPAKENLSKNNQYFI